MSTRTVVFLGVAFCLSALSLGACSSSSDVDTPKETANISTNEAALSSIPAGDAGTALGVSKWEISSSSDLARARNTAGTVVAEFVFDSDAGVIESRLPASGKRSVGNAGNGTLSAEAAAYLDALKADLEVGLDNSEDTPVGNSADGNLVDKSYRTYACYRLLADCQMQSLVGFMNGWWVGSVCTYPAAECPNNPYRIALRY